MNRLIVFILISSLHFHVSCQEDADPPLDAIPPLKVSVGLVLGLILALLFFTCILLAYAKLCHLLFSENTNDTPNPNFNGPHNLTSTGSGIERRIIESIPFFVFSSLKGSKEGLECSVCLSKFEDSDVLKLLPKCKHAFHIDCIDQWLEIHSTCPLCRYRFSLRDLESFRLSQSPSNLTDDPNVVLFIEREENEQVQRSSSRFSIGSSFHGSNRRKKEEFLIQEGGIDEDGKIMHKLKHKIIVSDVVLKRRWSDLNPSDLMSLNSDMLSFLSSKRFNSLEPAAGRRFSIGSSSIQIDKLKEDLERKRMLKSKFETKDTDPSSSFSYALFNDESNSNSSKLNRIEKRSVSEITIFSRFKQFSHVKNQFSSEKMKNVWLPMVQKTVQQFSRQERSSQEPENNRQRLNI